jgi:GT2 family glycosyltransferase
MPASGRATLAVVVCCYTEERWPLLVAAIDALHVQTRPIDEIIIVVDHNDALLRRVRDAQLGVTVVPNDEARGLSGARNSGVRAARGEVVAFVDDDVVVAPNWSERLAAPYADPAVLGVGGRILPMFEEGVPRWLPPELDWIVGCTYQGHRASIGPVRNLIGANMSFRRDVFERIRGFRSDLGRAAANGAGCEETEFCIRATRDLGGVVWYEPAAVVSHYVPVSRTTREYFRARCFGEGVSKAQIARLAGHERGLASERKYVRSTLPHAVGRELLAGVVGRRTGAFARAAAIVSALAIVSAGYFWGLLALGWRNGETEGGAPFEPFRVAEVDVDAPEEIRRTRSSAGLPYRRALVLVRRHGAPTALLEMDLHEGALDREVMRAAVGEARTKEAEQPAQLAPRRRPPETPPLVSVVVATCDRPEALLKTLDSLLACQYEPFEVIIVDNGSTEGNAADAVTRVAANDPRVRYVREERRGLARAHNRGLQVALGSIVAFTDDDVVVDRRWIEAIVTAFGDDEEVACVTGMILPFEIETETQEWIERAFGFGKGLATRRFDLDGHRPDDPLFPFTAGTFGSGANMAFRSTTLRAIDGFDAALGAGTPAAGGDDLAAFYDVVARGGALVYEPSAIVWHTHRRDYGALRTQAFRYGVGLGAYLAHVVFTDPRALVRVAPRLRDGVRHLVHEDSTKNSRRPATFPRELVWRERAGVLRGPLAYLRSRRLARNDGWIFIPPETGTTASQARAEGKT